MKSKFTPKKKEEVKVEEVKEIKEEVVEEKIEDVVKEVEKEVKSDSIWEVGGTKVHATVSSIKFQPIRATIPMYMLPDDIRQYLIDNGFWTNVYQKDKERLEKHWADMKMIEKLKKYLSDNYNNFK